MTVLADPRRVNIVQGERLVSRDPGVTLTTLLGSCIACCLYDPAARVGGMNHFLLAEPPGETARGGLADIERYGLFAMEMLVNAVLKKGATRPGLRAHLYGGATIQAGRAIGEGNAGFALRFLRQDGIRLTHHDVGGTAARRVEFQPAHGRARCRAVGDAVPASLFRAPPPPCGDVEFF